MRRLKRTMTSFLCALGVMAAASISAAAEQPLDTAQDVSLTITYTHESQPLKGAEFSLYRVADTDANTNLTVVGDFAKYPVKYTNLTDDEWQSLALTLSGYAQRDVIEPISKGTTDNNGIVSFPNGSAVIKPGLYLLTGKSVTIDGFIYKAKPSMVFLPGSEDGKNTWEYKVNVKPKYERTQEPKLVTCKALKVWNDKGYESNRPKEIRVDLLKDGRVFDTAVLNSGNSWRYTWNDLSEKNDWTLVEREISGYTVKVEKEGATFKVTNTNVPTTTPPSDPTKPPRVPQTGLTWWPVPLFAVCGALMLLIGIAKRKRQ